jgi:hypothetical protein
VLLSGARFIADVRSHFFELRTATVTGLKSFRKFNQYCCYDGGTDTDADSGERKPRQDLCASQSETQVCAITFYSAYRAHQRLLSIPNSTDATSRTRRTPLVAVHTTKSKPPTSPYLRSEHGPHEQPLLIRTVLLRECDELVDVPVARDILAPEHVRSALTHEPDTEARR